MDEILEPGVKAENPLDAFGTNTLWEEVFTGGMRIMNSILILACKIPYVRNKYYGNIKKFPSIRFRKLIDKILSNQT